LDFSKGNRDNKPVMRSRALPRWLAGLAVLAALWVFGLTSAQDDPPKPQGDPAKPKEAPTGRRAKRPPPTRIQTKLELASQTKVEFRQPVELAYKDFNELVVQAGTFESGHAGELGLPSKFQLLCYNDQPVGPTIRVRRGTTFHIRVKNALPAAAAAPAHQADNNSEQPHELCTTNLHTHGLHVSPAGNADNVFVDVKPQEEFTFEYSVPADHPSGTFWYHPHRHGSVAYQLSNGLAGALIVEGPPRDGIADLEDVPEIAAAKERVLVFQLYNYRVDPPGQDGVARIDARTIYDVAPDARACPAVAVPDQDPTEKGQATAINGLINPIIRLAPGEVQRWRLIHAAWDVNRRLYLGDKDGKPATDLQFYEIALDGLATGTMTPKGNKPDDPGAAALVEIAPGQRSDVLIRAPLLGEGEKEHVYYLLQSAQEHGPTEPPPNENLILAKILVGGPAREMRLPDPRDLLKCQPFANIRDEELATTDTSEINAKGLAFNASKPGMAMPHFWLNKKTYRQYQSPVQIRLNTAEQWKVKAVSENHPFHIHVNPFQVVMLQTDSDPNNPKPMSVWRDTLFVREGETYTIRSRFKDFLGKTVIHCHFLDHEDQGMMMPIEFIPPYQAPKPAVVAQGPVLKPDSAVAPALKLADPNGTWHELTEFRPRNVLLVFFQGMECRPCTEQLARLVGEARARIHSDTEIVAISSRRIADLGRAVKALGVHSGDRFTLLVDEECRAFRSLACYKDGPLHGLFVIDRIGVIRASYTGEIPFDDVQAVADWVKSLADTGTRRPGQ
jgi:FtsP/CotA-like multicopper oxidase with cupredoxin domain/peroxiredoxin